MSVPEFTDAQARQVLEDLARQRDEAEAKAWDALGRYKFYMFGYWAARVVQINHDLGVRTNPFTDLVVEAKRKRGDYG